MKSLNRLFFTSIRSIYLGHDFIRKISYDYKKNDKYGQKFKFYKKTETEKRY